MWFISCTIKSLVLFFSHSQFYNHDSSLPVYEWTHSRQKFSVLKLGKILLGGIVPKEKICNSQPVSVCHNVTFVVDLHSLDDPKDLRADENGVWKHKGAPIAYISVHRKRGEISEAKHRTRMGAHPHYYKISRTYYQHATSTDFCRIITVVQFKVL